MITIRKNNFKVDVNELGAEVFSIEKDGIEYLHNGDKRYWGERSPIMFPICGRLEGGYYTFEGKRYEMPPHGIAKLNRFTLVNQSQTSATFSFKSDKDTRISYPFEFELIVDFAITDDALSVTYTVKNTDDKTIYFSIGGHPGFKMPIENKGSFEDCYIEFEKPCTPILMGLSPRCFRSGNDVKFSDTPITTIPLNSELFSNDAIFLSETCGSLCVKSKASDRYIKFEYDGFKYIGFWQPYNIDAPFVCVEPWFGSPSIDSIIDDFKTKEDMIALDINKVYTVSHRITIK